MHAVDINGVETGGWPKFTNGWMIGTPAVGDVDGDGLLEVVATTREGKLFVWKTGGDECGFIAWRRWHHDEWGTGNYHTDARPPASLPMGAAFIVAASGTRAELHFDRIPGDDLFCGTAQLDVRYSESPIEDESDFAAATEVPDVPPVPGNRDGGTLAFEDGAFSGKSLYFAFTIVDDAGNRSALTTLPSAVEFVPTTPTDTPSPTSTPETTATFTPTGTPAGTVSATVTPTGTPAGTASATFTPTFTETIAPTATATPTTGEIATATATSEATSTATPTLEATATSTNEPTATATPTSEATATSTIEPTATATNEATETVTPTTTSTTEPTATVTSEATATATPTSEATATSTAEATATSTAESTATSTAPATATSTRAATSTSTATRNPSATSTPAPTGTATAVPPSPTSTIKGGVVDDDGCQIAQRPDDRGPWWLGLAPLLLVATRRRRK